MRIKLICLLALVVFNVAIYVKFQEGRVCINNERVGLMLLRGGYRAWWIRYSQGLKYPYRPFRDNLWCWPQFEHCDIRPFLEALAESAKGILDYRNRCPDCHEDGGFGPRCPKHEIEYIEGEIACGQQRIKELKEKINED